MYPNVTQQAIAAAGGPTAVGEKIKKTKGAVSQWGTKNCVPSKYVVELCHLTRGVFQPHQLRPDFFSEEVRV